LFVRGKIVGLLCEVIFQIKKHKKIGLSPESLVPNGLNPEPQYVLNLKYQDVLCGSYHWENDHNDSNVYVKLTDYQKKKIFTLTFYLLCSYPDIELYYINMENSYDFYLIHEKISHHQFDDVKMKD